VLFDDYFESQEEFYDAFKRIPEEEMDSSFLDEAIERCREIYSNDPNFSEDEYYCDAQDLDYKLTRSNGRSMVILFDIPNFSDLFISFEGNRTTDGFICYRYYTIFNF